MKHLNQINMKCKNCINSWELKANVKGLRKGIYCHIRGSFLRNKCCYFKEKEGEEMNGYSHKQQK